MKTTKTLTIIALLTSLIITSDYALAPIPNVKILDTIVFASAYSLGFRIGASVAVLSELIWGVISPYGAVTPIIFFLISGELLFAFAGWGASKVWGDKVKILSSKAVYFAATLSVCAFVWDTYANFGTALLVEWNHLSLVTFMPFEIASVAGGFLFSHMIGDLVIGAILAPIAIKYLSRVFPKDATPVGREIGEPQVG